MNKTIEVFKKLAKIYGIKNTPNVVTFVDDSEAVFDNCYTYMFNYKLHNRMRSVFLKKYELDKRLIIDRIIMEEYWDTYHKADLATRYNCRINHKASLYAYAYLCMHGKEKEIKDKIKYYQLMHKFNIKSVDDNYINSIKFDIEEVKDIIMNLTSLGKFRVTKTSISHYSKRSLVSAVYNYSRGVENYSNTALNVIIPVYKYVKQVITENRQNSYYA